MKNILTFLAITYICFTWIVSIALLIIIAPHLLFFIFPDYSLFANLTIFFPDPRFLLLASCISSLIGILLLKLLKKKTEYFRYLSFGEKVLYILLSLLLSYFFFRSFTLLNKFGVIELSGLFILLYAFLPVYIYFLSQGFEYIQKIIDRQVTLSKSNPLHFILALFVIIVSTAIIVKIGILTNSKIQVEIKKKQLLSRNPAISKVEPSIVYQGTKVIIFGSNLGWKQNEKVRLIAFDTRRRDVYSDLWTDHKIIFTVPLDWKIGTIYLAVEKPIEWEGKKVIATSQVFHIKLISRTNGWDKEDDAFFNQLKNLDSETLKINNYDR